MAVVSSASAAVTFLLAFWLEGGGGVSVTTLVESSGELLLENQKSAAGAASLQKCSSVRLGDVGPNSADDITEVLTLGGTLVSPTPLTGEPVKCELEVLCENSSEIWMVHLPWLTEVELWEVGGEEGFVDLVLPHSGGGNPGWYVECKTSLITVSEECLMSEGVAEQVNVGTGVKEVFSEAFTLLMEAKLSLCSGNKEETGNVEGSDVETVPGGKVLSVSPSFTPVTFLLAFWLEGGGGVSVTTLVESSGELLLENQKSAAGAASLQKCSGVRLGDVGPNSADDITEVLTLGGTLVSLTPLTGEPVKCELEVLCENSSKVWMVNLPWLTEVELWEVGGEEGFVDLVLPHVGGGNPGWYVECKALLTVSEECTTPEGVAKQVNVATGVEEIFSEAFTLLMEAKLFLCSGNAEETGNVEGSAIEAIPGGQVLSVSPPSSPVTFLLASWLAGGANVTVTTLVESSGELLLENQKSAAGAASLQKCSGVRLGDVGPNSADDITEVLTLGGTLVSLTPLTGEPVKCELEVLCENSSKVWMVNLPWLTEVELWEVGGEEGFVDLVLPHVGGGNPGWYVECKALLTVSEECTTPEGVAKQVNVATGVEEIFSEAFTLLMEAKLFLCSGNAEETGNVEGSSVETVPGGGVLSASSS